MPEKHQTTEEASAKTEENKAEQNFQSLHEQKSGSAFALPQPPGNPPPFNSWHPHIGNQTLQRSFDHNMLTSLGPGMALNLQRLIGNQAVIRLGHDRLASSPIMRQIANDLSLGFVAQNVDIQRDAQQPIRSGHTPKQHALEIGNMVYQSIFFPMSHANQERVMELMEIHAELGDVSEFLTALDKMKVVTLLFMRLSEDHLQKLGTILEGPHAQLLQSRRNQQGLGLKTLPPELKQYWLARMDADVVSLRLSAEQLEERKGDKTSHLDEIVAIFRRWDQFDKEQVFNNRLLREFLVHKVADEPTTRTGNLLDNIRTLADRVYYRAIIEGYLRQVGYDHPVPNNYTLGDAFLDVYWYENPQTKAIASAVDHIFKHKLAFLEGLASGALTAVEELDNLDTEIFEFIKKLATNSQELWDEAVKLVSEIDDIAIAFWKEWTQKDPKKRAYFQGEVIGYILVQVLVNIVLAGALAEANIAVQAPRRASRLARLFKKIPSSRLQSARSRLGRWFSGRFKKKRIGDLDVPNARNDMPKPPVVKKPTVPKALVNGVEREPDIPNMRGAYHGTTLEPEDVMTNGMKAKGDNWDLIEHSVGRSGDSAFRGTSTQLQNMVDGKMSGPVHFADEGGWVYELEGVPGWDVNRQLQGQRRVGGEFKNNLMQGEHEIAIPGNVPPDKIVRFGKVEKLGSGRLGIKKWYSSLAEYLEQRQ